MKFSTDFLKDPEVFQIGTCQPHSSHMHYRNETECKMQKSSFHFSLNGTWLFHYSENLAALPDGFECLDYNHAAWKTITVPSHIQLSGYGHPHYVNTMYPWDGVDDCQPGEIQKDYNPTGSYIKWVTLPEELQQEKKLHIVFHGAESAMALWVNGAFLGYHEDSFTPAEFDITDALRVGENKIAVQVFQRSSGSWLEDQDFWRFSGLFREVEIVAFPKAHLTDLFIKTNLTDQFQHADIFAELQTCGEENILLKAVLYDPHHQIVGEQTVPATTKELLFSVQQPELWSAEQPHLYRMQITLLDAAKNVIEVISQSIGIRQFRMENGLMQLNGKRIVFYGVNRHEFNCMHGRVVSKEDMLWDVKTMKQHNINAVRTSHYPNQSYFYQLCDEYGLYVIDETNLETHGTWQKMGAVLADENTIPNDNPKWTNAVMARAAAMLERDKNHPCVLIWSCGNESYGGSNIFKMSEFFRRRDSSRLVHYEGVFHDRRFSKTSDMESQMYPPVSQIEAYLKDGEGKPFLCCEYSHAMGNSNGGLSCYTDLAKREPRYQGGFIWDFIDQGLLKKDRYGKYFAAFGGDYGDRPTDYNFCMNGIIFADRTLSPKMAEVKYCYQPFAICCTETDVTIENLQLFTDSSAYRVVLTLCRNGEEIARICCEDWGPIAPQEIRTFPQPLSDSASGEYVLTASMQYKTDTLWARSGDGIAFGQTTWKVATPKEVLLCSVPKLIVGDVNYGIQGEEFHIIFGRDKCGIISYQKNGKERIAPLMGIPRPNFWRAPTDNDNGWRMPQLCAFWKTASLYPIASVVSCQVRENAVEIVTKYQFPIAESAGCMVTYLIFGDGSMQITMQLFGCESFGIMPDFGMLLRMPYDFRNLEWYGRGPAENYCDRKDGCKIGKYQSTVFEQVTPYVIPQECGNHTDTRWFSVTDKDGNGFRISAECMDFSVLPYTPHELENAYHPNELPAPYYSVLKISAGQTGVGGDDSWGARPHPDCIREARHSTAFTFFIQAL